jgi:His/Glu/Gln/Arg/opine family amino acid ABC transporter permease subunit
MLNYDWHFDRLLAFQPAFMNGVLMTLELSAALILFSTTLGVTVGILLRRRTWWSRPVVVVIDILKGLPPLVVILFGYYLLTEDVVGVTVPVFWAIVLSLGLNIAAFIADLTRASLSNVPREYVEMGTAMGLRNDQLVRLVIFPLAIRELIPPLSYLYIETIKLTSLASVLAVREVVYAAETVTASLGRSLEAWVVVGVIYLALVLPVMFLARMLEAHFKREVGVEPHSACFPGY